MATVTLTGSNLCALGGHLTLTLTGDVTGAGRYDIEEIKSYLNSIGPEEMAAAILRLAQVGRTTAQLKTLLAAGVTVTI